MQGVNIAKMAQNRPKSVKIGPKTPKWIKSSVSHLLREPALSGSAELAEVLPKGLAWYLSNRLLQAQAQTRLFLDPTRQFFRHYLFYFFCQ